MNSDVLPCSPKRGADVWGPIRKVDDNIRVLNGSVRGGVARLSICRSRTPSRFLLALVTNGGRDQGIDDLAGLVAASPHGPPSRIHKTIASQQR
jgi:hypothetical protein